MGFGLGAHIAYSAIFCTGLVYFLGLPARPRRRGAGIGLMLTAMVLHGVWDDVGGIVGRAVFLLFVLWIVMTVITLAVVVTLFSSTVRPERAFMREVLAPEVASGVITAEEADTLAGDRRARRAYRHASGDKTTRRWVLSAAHDPADELARADGADSSRVRFARQEIARLRTQRHPTDAPVTAPAQASGSAR